MIKVNFEQLADMVTDGDFVMDVNMEMEYKGWTIVVNNVNGENPFCETETCSRGGFRKVCIVPEGEYKWSDTFWTIDEAKRWIDIY